jgi:Ca2+-transporting ATPase
MNNPLAGGLSALAAAQRLQQEGPNELPRGARRTLWRIVLEALRAPMSQFLLAGVAIYLLWSSRNSRLAKGEETAA